MRNPSAFRSVVTLSFVAIAVFAGCTPSTPSAAPATAAPSATPAQTPVGTATTSASPSLASPSGTGTAVALADAAKCPRTKGTRAPAEIGDQMFGYDSSYGNGKLWVGALWPDGIVKATPDFVQPDGSIGMKFAWWRKTPGHLEITGRRLDAPAPPAFGQLSDYGDIGFQASGVIFPTEGCWEITGRVGDTALSFVTFVIKAA